MCLGGIKDPDGWGGGCNGGCDINLEDVEACDDGGWEAEGG